MEITKLQTQQSVCTVKSEKGEICSGHLKEWMSAPESVRKQLTPNAKLYRCKRCQAIYMFPPQEHLHASKDGEFLPPQKPEMILN